MSSLHPLKPGTQAPDFTLKHKTATGLQDVKLSSHHGKEKVVLLFFPLAFTGTCTDEMCVISQDLDVYGKLGAVVYGISVDNPFAQEAWAIQNKMTIALLSDFNKTVCADYGVLCPDLKGQGVFKGLAYRSAFVIDRDGKILYSWGSENPGDLPDFNHLKAALG
jgi:glutaredoxin-dependent peroxiredoxin